MCVCHWLTTGRVLDFQQNSALTHSPWHCLYCGSGTTIVHITTSNSANIKLTSGLQYLWHRRLAWLLVLCVQNVNELKQHLLDVWYGMKQSIIDRAITSPQACWPLMEEILRYQHNNINNWLNHQYYHLCETLISFSMTHTCAYCPYFA